MIDFSWKVFNPLYWHIIDAINNPEIRFILIYGGSSAAKTYSITQAQIIDALENENSTLSMRKYSVDIATSTYADAKSIGEKINKTTKDFVFQINKIKIGKARIQFRGLDYSHKLQGITEFKRIYADEITHFAFEDFKQMKKRLRGKVGQQIIASWNPISVNHWINKDVIKKEKWIDLPNEIAGNKRSKLYSEGTVEENSFKKINETGNMLLIKTTYRDNWWIVGHPAGEEYGFRDKHVIADFAHDKIHNPVDYDIYANGNWGILTERLAFRPSEWTIIDEIPEKAKRIPSGLDFGWNPDPTAVCDFYIYENYLIWDELVYERELNNARQFNKDGEEVGKSIQERLEDQGFDKTHTIVAESAELKSIEELRIAGFNIHAVRKRGIIEGVKLLKKYHHLITRRSKNVIYEFENYQKKVDRDDNILNEYIDEDNHCFVGETKILTKYGQRSIEKIKKGDLVLTSKGERKVLLKWNNGTKKTNKYVMLFDTFTLTLVCTSNHKIKTSNGWIRASKLKTGMEIHLSRYSMGKNIDFTVAKDTIREALKDYIELFGNFIMALFQKDFIYTTKTKILQIMKSKILNWFGGPNTYRTTQENIAKNIQNGSRIFMQKELTQHRNGINQKRAISGIRNTLKKSDLESSHSEIENARYAKKNLQQGPITSDFVQITASHNSGEPIKQIGSRYNVPHVEKPTKEINTEKAKLVQLFVEEGTTEQVYDLTVEGSHEYFANGVLVHNCMDLARYVQFMKGMLW